MRNAVAIVVFVSTLLSLAAAAQEVVQKSVCKVRDSSLAELLATERNTAAPRVGGFLGTYRYHLNRWISAEAAYGYDVNTQRYSVLSSAPFRI